MIDFLKSFSRDYSSKKYWLYLFLIYIKKYNIISIPVFMLMIVYSYLISTRLFGFSLIPKVCFSNGIFRIKILKYRGSSIILKRGILVFEKWKSGNLTSISLSRNSRFEILDSFIIGDNCKIQLSEGASLKLLGSPENNKSGITADSIILCSKEITIGSGTIISWNCYITDSSQHSFNGFRSIKPVVISDNVWISESVTCGPGAFIGCGAVIGAKSFVNSAIPESSFAVGCPALVKKTNVTWSR